jgi:hypothetical protein
MWDKVLGVLTRCRKPSIRDEVEGSKVIPLLKTGRASGNRGFGGLVRSSIARSFADSSALEKAKVAPSNFWLCEDVKETEAKNAEGAMMQELSVDSNLRRMVSLDILWRMACCGMG